MSQMDPAGHGRQCAAEEYLQKAEAVMDTLAEIEYETAPVFVEIQKNASARAMRFIGLAQVNATLAQIEIERSKG